MRGKGERRHWACESGFPIPKHTVNTRPKARRQHRSRHRRSSFTNCRRSERHPAPPATPRRKAAQQHPLPGSGETRRGLRGLTLAALVRVRLGPSCYLPRCAAWGTSEWKAREHLGSPRALEPGSSRQGRAAARCASCAIGAGGIAAAARAEARRPCNTGRHRGHPAHLQRVARTERERRGRGLACASPYRPAPLCAGVQREGRAQADVLLPRPAQPPPTAHPGRQGPMGTVLQEKRLSLHFVGAGEELVEQRLLLIPICWKEAAAVWRDFPASYADLLRILMVVYQPKCAIERARHFQANKVWTSFHIILEINVFFFANSFF